MNRRLNARLGRLEEAVTVSEGGPVCRFHGQHCQMGRNWPLPFPEDHDSELIDMIHDAQRAIGQQTKPHPRDVWATDWHERKTAAELAAEKEELARLIAEAQAKNAAAEAELRGEVP